MEALVKNMVNTLPKTLAQAWVGEDAEAWREAAELEFNTLTSMGVLDHNYTLEELATAGVETQPIPMRVVLDNKYGGEGEFLKQFFECVIMVEHPHASEGIEFKFGSFTPCL